MPGPVSSLEILRGFSKPSTRPRAAVWVSAYLSAARSSRDIMAASGLSRMTGQVRYSRFLFPADQTALRTRLQSKDVVRTARRVALHEQRALRCLLEEGSYGCFYHNCFR